MLLVAGGDITNEVFVHLIDFKGANAKENRHFERRWQFLNLYQFKTQSGTADRRLLACSVSHHPVRLRE